MVGNTRCQKLTGTVGYMLYQELTGRIHAILAPFQLIIGVILV